MNVCSQSGLRHALYEADCIRPVLDTPQRCPRRYLEPLALPELLSSACRKPQLISHLLSRVCRARQPFVPLVLAEQKHRNRRRCRDTLRRVLRRIVYEQPGFQIRAYLGLARPDDDLMPLFIRLLKLPRADNPLYKFYWVLRISQAQAAS